MSQQRLRRWFASTKLLEHFHGGYSTSQAQNGITEGLSYLLYGLFIIKTHFLESGKGISTHHFGTCKSSILLNSHQQRCGQKRKEIDLPRVAWRVEHIYSRLPFA